MVSYRVQFQYMAQHYQPLARSSIQLIIIFIFSTYTLQLSSTYRKEQGLIVFLIPNFGKNYHVWFKKLHTLNTADKVNGFVQFLILYTLTDLIDFWCLGLVTALVPGKAALAESWSWEYFLLDNVPCKFSHQHLQFNREIS